MQKNRFSELVNPALADGPQRVQRRDDAVFVVSERDYDKLLGNRASFKAFLLSQGPALDGLDVDCDRSPMRDIKL